MNSYIQLQLAKDGRKIEYFHLEDRRGNERTARNHVVMHYDAKEMCSIT